MNATNLEQRALEIKVLMLQGGRTQLEIATALKVDRRAIWQCLTINPKTGDFILKDPYIREGIARYLGLTFKDVWHEDCCYPDPRARKSPFFTKSNSAG